MSDHIDVPVIDRKTGQEVADPGPQVLDFRTGEVLTVRDASTDQLAAYLLDLRTIRDQLTDAERTVSDELVARLDRDATWTWRGAGVKVSAPSPTAGSDVYPDDALEGALRELMEQHVISEAAADKALQRRLSIEVLVPWGSDHRALAERVKESPETTIGHVPVKILKADHTTKPVASGIKDLRKLPGVGEALDKVVKHEPVGSRRAKVERAEE